MAVPRVLIVDDEPCVLKAVERLLRPSFDVTTCTRADAALAALRKEHYDVLVADYLMPDMDGALLLEVAHELSPTTARVLMTGSRDLNDVRVAVTQGEACRLVPKPFRQSQITQAVADALESSRRAQSHGPVSLPVVLSPDSEPRSGQSAVGAESSVSS